MKNPGKDANGKQLFNLHPFLPIIQWGVEFGAAATIELKKEDLERTIQNLEKQMADAKLLIERTEMVIKDIKEVEMEEYYEKVPMDLAERKLAVDQIHIEDQRQSIQY